MNSSSPKRISVVFLLCFLLCGLADSLKAQTVNPLSFSGSRVFSGTFQGGRTNTVITGPGSYSSPISTDIYGDSSASHASAALSPSPSISVSATASDPNGPTIPVIGGQISPAVSSEGTVQLTYFVDIAGPVGGSVDLTVNALEGVAGTPSGTASTTSLGGTAAAVFEVNKYFDYTADSFTSGNVLYDSLITGNGSSELTSGDNVDLNTTGFASGAVPVGAPEVSGVPFSDTYSVDGTYTFLTNVEYSVFMSVNADSFFYGESFASNPTGTASYSAFIDPTFQIASTVSNPSAYDLIFSNGIGDSVSGGGTGGGSSVADVTSTAAMVGMALLASIALANSRSRLPRFS